MTPLALFQQLCEVTDALQAECVRVDFSPHKIALEAIVDRLDVLLDDIIEMRTETLEDEEDATDG